MKILRCSIVAVLCIGMALVIVFGFVFDFVPRYAFRRDRNKTRRRPRSRGRARQFRHLVVEHLPDGRTRTRVVPYADWRGATTVAATRRDEKGEPVL